VLEESDGEYVIPDEVLYNVKDSGNPKSCIICMEPLKKGEAVRILECTHVYHSKCIDQWIQESNTCPMCKNPVIKRIN